MCRWKTGWCLKSLRRMVSASANFIWNCCKRLLEHELQDLLRRAGIPHRRERLPVQRRGTELAQAADVRRRAVALVGSQAVHRKDRVPGGDHAVALDLG